MEKFSLCFLFLSLDLKVPFSTITSDASGICESVDRGGWSSDSYDDLWSFCVSMDTDTEVLSDLSNVHGSKLLFPTTEMNLQPSVNGSVSVLHYQTRLIQMELSFHSLKWHPNLQTYVDPWKQLIIFCRTQLEPIDLSHCALY